jgi:hypothetical protein
MKKACPEGQAWGLCFNRDRELEYAPFEEDFHSLFKGKDDLITATGAVAIGRLPCRPLYPTTLPLVEGGINFYSVTTIRGMAFCELQH